MAASLSSLDTVRPSLTASTVSNGTRIPITPPHQHPSAETDTNAIKPSVTPTSRASSITTHSTTNSITRERSHVPVNRMKGTDVPVPIINSAIGKHVHGHKPSGSVSERIALFQRLQNTSSSTTSPIVESKVRITPRRLSAGRMPKWIGHPHPTVSSSGTATIDKTNITNEADMATLSRVM
ncbi:hypothetical protein BASA61_003191, partial [Batrachochytrium salamandrivorans]